MNHLTASAVLENEKHRVIPQPSPKQINEAARLLAKADESDQQKSVVESWMKRHGLQNSASRRGVQAFCSIQAEGA